MSVGHCRRVCKILRSECWRQSRFLKDCLRAACSTCGDARIDRRSYRVWYESAVNLTEVLWRQVWVVLPKKQKNAGEPGRLLVLGDTQVDEEQKDILKLGHKFCVEPSLQLPDRLSLTRDISRNALDSEEGRCFGSVATTKAYLEMGWTAGTRALHQCCEAFESI
ncbi:hypothetical protein HPB50_009848 [Hyalomma asiaticum]|uniref:Uncharacterized protein n=1 Tax=Hyalomma asiaticum TaxID=266040 RepID=A0ACB7RZV9_HYAAI|nr:hypothetical protein HPB50_009848 [Hyalomma asiaticum]